LSYKKNNKEGNVSKSIEFIKNLDRIVILAQGPSWCRCPKKREFTGKFEIWGSNVIYRDYPEVDRLFFGHDIREGILHDDIYLVKNVNRLNIPVYTTGIFRVLRKNAQIPINQIVSEFGIAFFLNVIAYMIATAILQKPKIIDMYGVDMRPDAGVETYVNEKGSVEFWLGVAIGRGIKIENTEESFVLKTKQEGDIHNFRKKVPQAGLYSTIPESHRNPYVLQNYYVEPVGDEI